MAIELPSLPAPNAAQPLLRDYGGVLSPFLGGPEQRINRIGNRFGIQVSMPPMRGETGRQYVARLLRGRADRVLMEWPLLDFDPGTPGSPQINTAASGGSAISIKGLTASYPIVEGQFFSIIHASRRYMHMATGDVAANGSGIAAVSIFPPLRTAVSVNDVVEIATPMIEGHVSPGEELGWAMALEHTVGLSFSVMETK